MPRPARIAWGFSLKRGMIDAVRRCPAAQFLH